MANVGLVSNRVVGHPILSQVLVPPPNANASRAICDRLFCRENRNRELTLFSRVSHCSLSLQFINSERCHVALVKMTRSR